MTSKTGSFRSLIFALLTSSLLFLLACSPSPTSYSNWDSSGEKIICLGDSLTSCVGAKKVECYPALLSERFGYEFINKGVAGNTTTDALGRLERDVLSKKPRLVIVLLGANDYFHQTPKEKTLNNLIAIIEKCQEAGAMVCLVGVNLGLVRDQYDEVYEEAADGRDVLYIPDVLDDVIGEKELMNDKIHPNSEGYTIMAERIGDELEPVFEAWE